MFEEQGQWEKLSGKITTIACYLLPPQIFPSVCVDVSFLPMADLLLLMLAKYSWM